ncbi:hypothetical protein E2C01_030320 [Portunus trituberculatus]|uniref:Uncharacterized protein n=1 Tax=Portunus trituberculatus TaxID=210409 RepID=A0A5B7EVD8_PORTR|nr:hypothetical protein [Portunus trituberculatus]
MVEVDALRKLLVAMTRTFNIVSKQTISKHELQARFQSEILLSCAQHVTQVRVELPPPACPGVPEASGNSLRQPAGREGQEGVKWP